MNSLQDMLYNWLTIKLVADARPDDSAAVETMKHFEELMLEKYGVSVADLKIETDEVMYYIHYPKDGETKKTRFPRELIEVILNQITQEPEKFRNYPDESAE